MHNFIGLGDVSLNSETTTEARDADAQNRQEDLGLYGNELNYMQTCWTVGYVIGEIPSNIILTKIRPRYWLPTLEVSNRYKA
ncbi:unnamed protein product [Aureobasidium vineae]|uniref:Uncharacterized protein n=1 Tax=Aureobasidium vineae TaxID=2773715 RepID=A0A9N8PC37_9PEZI|nr:unnamed protein product [Aureobasidium vineae]